MSVLGLPTIKIDQGQLDHLQLIQQSFAVNMIILRQYVKGWFSQVTHAKS